MKRTKITIQYGVQVVLMNATTQLSNIAYYSNNQDKIYDNDWPRTIDAEISKIADNYYYQVSVDPDNALDWAAFTVDDLFALGFYRHIIDKDGITVWMIPAYLWGIIPEGLCIYELSYDKETDTFTLDDDGVPFRRDRISFKVVDALHLTENDNEVAYLGYGIKLKNDEPIDDSEALAKWENQNKEN